MSGDGEELDEGSDIAETEKAAFRRLLDTLRSDYGFDFREYETLSLLRRLRARMAHVRVDGFDTYVEYLRLHGQEATALLSSILMMATEELETTNEELQSANEELQSTNKELVTTVDELQAANAELAVRSSELQRLSLYHASVVDSVSDGIVVLDTHFTVTSWNPAAERLLGVAAKAAIGRDFFTLSIGTPVQRLRAALARIASREAPDANGVVEFEVPRIEGERRAAVMRLMPLVDADGAPQGFLGLGRAS